VNPVSLRAQTQRDPVRNVARRLAIIAIGTLLALTVLEPVLRQIFFFPPAWDPVLGRIPKPGSAVRWTAEGCGTSHWTVHGIRRSAPPAADQPNVVVLGDSFTEAMMVDDEDVFTQRAEVALRVGERVRPGTAGRRGMEECDDFMKLRLSSSGCETRPAKGSPPEPVASLATVASGWE